MKNRKKHQNNDFAMPDIRISETTVLVQYNLRTV